MNRLTLALLMTGVLCFQANAMVAEYTITSVSGVSSDGFVSWTGKGEDDSKSPLGGNDDSRLLNNIVMAGETVSIGTQGGYSLGADGVQSGLFNYSVLFTAPSTPSATDFNVAPGIMRMSYREKNFDSPFELREIWETPAEGLVAIVEDIDFRYDIGYGAFVVNSVSVTSAGPVNPVPEPASIAVWCGLAIAGCVFSALRKR